MLNLFNIQNSKLQLIYPPMGSLDLNEFIIPNTLPPAINYIESSTINMSFVVPMGPAGPQNIAAVSTVPIYAYIQYWVVDDTDPNFGKWIIDQTEANAVAYSQGTTPPDTLYDGKDPLLQRALVFTPSQYVNWAIKNYKFKNRKVYREDDNRLIEDASLLLASVGYFRAGFFYAVADPRKSLGSGVTDTTINNLFSIQNFVVTGAVAFVN